MAPLIFIYGGMRMKRFISILLCICFCLCTTGAASSATPTDLDVTDDNPGWINIKLIPKVYIVVEKPPEYFGDLVVLTAVFVDFQGYKVTNIRWEYAINENEWFPIENGHHKNYIFIFTHTNWLYWYRVFVEWEELK